MLHSFISIYGWEPALWFGQSRQTPPHRVIRRRVLQAAVGTPKDAPRQDDGNAPVGGAD